MASKTINPTRMELTRLKGRLRTAVRGHRLLKDKRDELMRQFMDVPIYEFHTKSEDAASIYPYGFAQTSGELDDALGALASVFQDMLELAQTEKKTQLLASEIEKTRRRVNALEYVMIPEMEKNIKYISMKLEENDRATKVRLMKVKDMVLKDAHNFEE